jgi:VanZ family protein
MHLFFRPKFVWVISFALLCTASVTHGISPQKAHGIDILFHLVIYSILSCMSVMLVKGRKAPYLTAIVMVLAGLFFEIMHGKITGFGFEPLDAIYNNIGIFLGIITGVLFKLVYVKDAAQALEHNSFKTTSLKYPDKIRNHINGDSNDLG